MDEQTRQKRRAMANGMSSLYVGASGLQSSQTALNTTAHNLANINTTGYTRQQILFSDSTYLNVTTLSGKTEKYGLGVAVTEINRIRDQFIDEAYRKGNARLGYYSSQSDALQEVEGLFGELQGVTYQSQINNLNTALNTLKGEPKSTVARSGLLQYASAFITHSNAIYDGLKDYQKTLNTSIDTMVDKINSLGDTINMLNKQISKIEANNVEHANDLRDQRDAALDELSSYIKISYYEGEDKQVRVNAEGAPFVVFGEVNKMSTREDSSNGLLIPTWPALDSDVYTQDISNYDKDNGDSGKLKGLLIARGYVDVDYTDVPVKPNEKDYDLSTPEGTAKYRADYDAYQKKQDYYNENIDPSIILSTMASLDKFVNELVTSINDILCPEKSMTTSTALKDGSGDEIQADQYTYRSANAKLYTVNGTKIEGTDNGDGTYSYVSDQKLYKDEHAAHEETVKEYTYSILDTDNTGYGMDEDKTVGQELFSRSGTDRYVTSTGLDGKTIYVRNNLNQRNHESDYKLGNLEMNSVVMLDGMKIPLSTVTGAEDIDRANDMYDVWSKDFGTLNPEQYASGTLDAYYNNFVGNLATVGKVLDNFVNAQDKMVSGYNNQRLQTAGVSSDEELEKMIKFQQAYNAASRYINVVSEMLEHLVTSLGRA